MVHKIFALSLFVYILFAAVAVGLRGWDYYITSTHERPFRSDYSTMKPSGTYSHGLGIIGAFMITLGVLTYSTRKRVRKLWDLGKLSRWLEFHIFLCLLGPILVVYHTTFKAGGIAAISLWTMLSVAASGIMGRFLYVQIPRNIKGTELTAAQIAFELDNLGSQLTSTELGRRVIAEIDRTLGLLPQPKTLSQIVSSFFRLRSLRGQLKRKIRTILSTGGGSPETQRELYHVAAARASLIQKSLLLSQIEKVFYYWHAVHLPFTVIMFLTLAAHVTVTVLLGYRWVF